jgi:N-acetylmuramoyl-L-alanine amidase
MIRKGLFVIPLLIICFSLLFTAALPSDSANAFSGQIIQQGATGDDVIELQSRLQYVGFYNGKIDGVFGWGTYWALRNFQYEYGLKVDGLAGGTTKQKLADATEYDQYWVKTQIRLGRDFTYYGGISKWKQTKINKNDPGRQAAPKQQANQGGGQQAAPQPAPQQNNQGGGQAANPPEQKPATNQKQQYDNVPSGYSQNDLKLMANAVYGEARGEPYVGQVAVAAVILNRVQSGSFPNTISGVIFEPRAFTAVADGQIWLTPNETAEKAVHDALNGWDPTSEAIYYFNPDTATSGWIWGRPQIKQIGKHIFAK